MGNVNLNRYGISKACLEYIRELSYEIYKLEAKLNELNNRSIVASPVAGEVHGSGVSDKVASTVQRKLELEQELSEKRSQLQERLDFIAAISDDELRDIVYCKCVQGFSFYEISKTTGMPKEAVKKRYYRFFQKFSQNS